MDLLPEAPMKIFEIDGHGSAIFGKPLSDLIGRAPRGVTREIVAMYIVAIYSIWREHF
jgi:hypothetical protein